MTFLQEDLLALSKWSHQWLFSFNVDKCKVLHYGKYNTNHENQLNNTAIPMDDIMKDLGVSFQSNLKFDKHVFLFYLYKICTTLYSQTNML